MDRSLSVSLCEQGVVPERRHIGNGQGDSVVRFHPVTVCVARRWRR
jgi:hypothetical protein